MECTVPIISLHHVDMAWKSLHEQLHGTNRWTTVRMLLLGWFTATYYICFQKVIHSIALGIRICIVPRNTCVSVNTKMSTILTLQLHTYGCFSSASPERLTSLSVPWSPKLKILYRPHAWLKKLEQPARSLREWPTRTYLRISWEHTPHSEPRTNAFDNNWFPNWTNNYECRLHSSYHLISVMKDSSHCLHIRIYILTGRKHSLQPPELVLNNHDWTQ